VSDDLLLREPLADGLGYPVAVSAESLALDLAELDFRKCPEMPDGDSAYNTAVNRRLTS
jgi:hypothetical protein